ncbi:patatin-like phospholipase family protein [Bacillus wiedmannii]|uniref:patatin-like phospholipase family protein n=1 Tax=Bacillus wiedmannii TaxID=1890302 RepID=UPI001CBDD969|nr:patatin-like phospholipase family protein [Bacillus wiedmannii]MBZ4223931.1 patatin-like phospholipase family protein [Bacillus wiedmannii]
MTKVGLVLAGGGCKGAYHIGVWKAFNEYGISDNICAVSGTSVGALNATLFSQGDYRIAETI